ncbi:MAG: TonB-dependent receptor, partial [Bacteroidota bacterium]|nr:TonB-dependent receptor [Bacteroidota bacterium]
FRTTGNASALQKAPLNDVKPESVSSFEAGYKGVMAKKVFLDAYTYYSHYTNFLARIGSFQSLTGNPPGLLNPATTRQFGYIQNSNQNVKAYGWGVTIEYQLPMRFIIYGNVYSDKLVIDSGNGNNVVSSKEREVQFPGIFFNTPDYRFNLGVRNENVYRNIGFNVIYKWQSENYYEGTFISGTLPSFGWLDAQVTYKVPKSKSMVRIGGTNILNNYQRTAYGNPYVGGLYYVSYGYNIF